MFKRCASLINSFIMRTIQRAFSTHREVICLMALPALVGSVRYGGGLSSFPYSYVVT